MKQFILEAIVLLPFGLFFGAIFYLAGL